MSYSRRQLEAFGEPLGDSITRKEGGRIIYGGGGSSAPPATQTQISDLPDWAKPSAQKLLGKAEALTETAPYQAYKGERVAGFTPLQEQAFEGVSRMDAGPQGFQQQVGQYMSPYMQNVVDREKMEAYRASQMLGQQQQARATQAGAFGGYREGIERAERERGLRSQLGDIQTRGLQSAYDRAADQFRTGITQGLAVGQQQSMLGGQQQQREQNILSQQYQDFLNQQRYPYQQLEFMSNILRGTPMGTVQTLYGAQPSLGQQIGALGMGAYGASKLFAEGGEVDSYAEGGVTSDENVEDILSKLSDAQLMQAKQIAMAQRDAERVQMIDAELAERASMKQGLGGAFNMLPQEQQDAVTEMAGGGIVAFANGGRPVYNPPDPTPLYAEASRLASELPAAVYTAPTQQETVAGISAQRGLVQEMMGADKLAPFMEELAAKRKELSGAGERAKGFAALASIEPMLKGRGIASIGAGVSKFGSELGRLEKENQDADRLLMASQVQLASAQQARADGQFDKASNLFNRAEELKEKGLSAKRDVLGRQATLQATMAGQASTAQSQKYGTDVQAVTSRDVANIQAGVQREGFTKPGDFERYSDRLDKIMRGESFFGGKTGEEGAKLFKQSYAEYGAGRMGVGETGMRPGTTPNQAAVQAEITKRLARDANYGAVQETLKLLELEAGAYARQNKPLPPELSKRIEVARKREEDIRKRIEGEIRTAVSGAPAGAPSAAPPGDSRPRPTLEQFLPAARAANPGVSDAQLRAFYESTYGGQ